MTVPFDNDTSRTVRKLAKRSLAAEKRRNLFVCCTIAFAVTLMAALSFVAVAQKAKVEDEVRRQYQVMVLVAARLDTVVGGSTLVRATVIIFFIGNEGLSILENTAIMGVPWPPVLKDTLEAMRKKGESQEKTKV